MANLDINYMLGNLVGRSIVIGLFAYVLWYIYNNNMSSQSMFGMFGSGNFFGGPGVSFPEQRRFGRYRRSNEYSRSRGYSRPVRYGRFRR
jgi:hypothetical protein